MALLAMAAPDIMLSAPIPTMLDWLAPLMLEFRASWALQQLTTQQPYGSIAYGYEKNSYSPALADSWLDESPEALTFLQQLDPQASATLAIDLYSGFTHGLPFVWRNGRRHDWKQHPKTTLLDIPRTG